MTVDDRARSAVADVRAAAEPTEVNPLLPSRRWLAAVVAVVVLLVGGVGVLSIADDEETVVADAARSSLRLAPTPPPDGAELLGASEGGSAEDRGLVWSGVWGTPGAADPFATTDLNVVVTPDVGTDALAEGAYREIGSDGTGVQVVELPFNLGRSATFVMGSSLVSVSSHHLTEDELRTAAVAVRLDGAAASIDAGALPVGLEPVAVMEHAAFYGIGLAGPPEATATTTSWAWRSRRAEFAISAVGGVDEAIVLANRYALGRGTVARTVRGRPAWQSADGQRLLWRPSPDVLVLLMTGQALEDIEETELSADDVLAIAETVAPVDDATWAAMLATVPDVGDSSPTTITAGDLDDLGIPVGADRVDADLPDDRRGIVYREVTGEICAVVAEPDSTSHSSCYALGAGPRVFYEGGKPFIVFGEAPDGTAEVTATVGGTVLTSSTSGGLWGFFLVVDGVDDEPVEVVYLDDAGAELGRAPVTP